MDETKLIEIKNPPRTVDLDRFGFTQAGKNEGNSTSYITHVESIYVGSLLDESIYVGKNQQQIDQIKDQIQDCKGAISRSQNDIDTFKAEIKKLNIKIDDYTDKLETYLSGGANKGMVGTVLETPSKARTAISSFFLLMLSVFIFFFYVAVVYKALFISTADIANALKNGDWGVSLLPQWAEVLEAIRNNTMVIFAPFMFYGFGYAIHILLEGKNKIKYLWIALVIIITFVLDYLLADQIHNKVQSALNMMGMKGNDKFEDILLVIIMGFVVYIIWSIIFHYWMGEIEKWNVSSRLGKLIRSTQKTKDELNQNVSEAEGNINLKQTDIKKLEDSININAIPLNEIVKSISLFSQGWFRFLAALGDEKLMTDCKTQVESFKSKKGLDFKLKNI